MYHSYYKMVRPTPCVTVLLGAGRGTETVHVEGTVDDGRYTR
jgi:hypothetical protein